MGAIVEIKNTLRRLWHITGLPEQFIHNTGWFVLRCLSIGLIKFPRTDADYFGYSELVKGIQESKNFGDGFSRVLRVLRLEVLNFIYLFLGLLVWCAVTYLAIFMIYKYVWHP
jgi:hypothetical protein